PAPAYRPCIAILRYRTRYTTRGRRVDVVKIRVPQAGMRTAGVIIAVRRSSVSCDCGIARQLTTPGRDLARANHEASHDGVLPAAPAPAVPLEGAPFGVARGRAGPRRVPPFAFA